MADTKHHHHEPSAMPVEGDGISYSGIVWFVVVLTATTVVCQLLMVGLFAYLDNRQVKNDAQRSAMAAPAGQAPAGPQLLTDEPANLLNFRQSEQKALTTYDWVDKDAGTVRLPIDRAKDLVIERGLPVRGATPAPAPEASKGK